MQNNASNPTTLYSSINYTGLAFPGPSAYPFYSASQSNTCNVYIPNDATLGRCASQKHPDRHCERHTSVLQQA